LNANTIVLFGSFSRADWHSKSDIDLFIIGDDNNLDKRKFEAVFKREIQIFSVKGQKEIKRMT
jgi:predicted nucleotidyltransferase